MDYKFPSFSLITKIVNYSIIKNTIFLVTEAYYSLSWPQTHVAEDDFELLISCLCLSSAVIMVRATISNLLCFFFCYIMFSFYDL